jgi:NAD(P)-dependent dehydrogenase (short-subunit alcohol dehydrogenase family)
MRERLRQPTGSRTDVPVQLIVSRRDPFISTALYEGLRREAPRLWRRDVDARHWIQRSHPDLVARHVAEFVDHVEGGTETRALRRARARAMGRPFADALVVVTGAGSGIGRATALAFAERGAEVVAVDIDGTAAQRTADLAGLLGAAAHWFEVDVSEASSMERLAKTIESDLGVPDVVVNNAGIGVAGPFLDTTVEEWQRVLDVNLWGVIHGSRLFARQMVDWGEGGHIVNVASGAAFAPSRMLPAYSTSKAAVLMLSECLRAELAEHGIGVSAICPGVVNTGITRTTRFVGADEAEQERRRRMAVRAYARRNFGPEKVAAEILRAVRDDLAVVPVAFEAKVGRAMSRLSPGVMRALARLKVEPR